jgi:putative SOS response-associated peptidase YedK
MCGRYTIVKPDGVTRWITGFTEHINPRSWFAKPRYNVAPSQLVPVVTNDGGGLQMFRWGLVPSWAKDEKIGYSMINARSETLAERPAFRNAFTHRRCLIPADGFYEWRKEADGKTKTPMYSTVDGGEVFAFAGLWEVWKNPVGEWVPSCTIITTTPNALMAPIHDRMPVILPAEAYAAWLTPGETSAAALMPLLKQFPVERMSVRTVSRLVNSPKNDGPELLE